MSYFNTARGGFFVLSSEFNMAELSKLNSFLLLLEKSTVGDILNEQKKAYKASDSTRGRIGYNIFNMFAVILYGFANGSPTLRNLEQSCTYDLRYIYLMNNERPSHMSFGTFINDYILPNETLIFPLITKEIFNVLKLQFDDAFVDGTKIEANANKYKFVWKPTTYHQKLDTKIRNLLTENRITIDIPIKEFIPSDYLTEVLSKESTRDIIQKKDIDTLIGFRNKVLEYELKEKICGPDRNSYYKTDEGATAMCLKEDYYSGLGSNMHAAYSIQIVVIHGFITSYLVSQSRSDTNDFILVMDRFNKFYNTHPQRVCADSAYGTLKNYKYLEKNEIGNYLKFQAWEGNVTGKRPDYYSVNEGSETIVCLNGKIGKKVEFKNRHPKSKDSIFFKVTGCRKCEFRNYCKRNMKKKSENNRIFEVNTQMQAYRKTAKENLLSPKGIEMRVNRSAQVEGAFGVIKQDMNYDRFRRVTLPKASNEFMITSLGYNIRKYLLLISGEGSNVYWVAPSDLQPETFKKPSAKRLSNRYKKKKKKSINETAKSSKTKKRSRKNSTS